MKRKTKARRAAKKRQPRSVSQGVTLDELHTGACDTLADRAFLCNCRPTPSCAPDRFDDEAFDTGDVLPDEEQR